MSRCILGEKLARSARSGIRRRRMKPEQRDNFGWVNIFLFGCFLAAARELMQRLAEGKTQKHQNRPRHWRCFAPEKNFFFSFCPIFPPFAGSRYGGKFFVFRNGRKNTMSKESKAYKDLPKKVYIRTFG